MSFYLLKKIQVLKHKQGIKRRPTTRGGYTLIEMLFYVFLLSLILLVVINVLVLIINSQKNLKASKNIENAAVISLERIVREIRNAKSLDLLNSNLNTTSGTITGTLQLNTTDDAGNPKTVHFFASSTVLSMKENESYTGPITPPNVSLTSLVFRQIDSGNTQAVKVDLTFQSGQGNYQKTVPFYTTAIIRGTY